jgi:GNAT superfamily N-acetyltransferase
MNNSQAAMFLLLILSLVYSGRIFKAGRYVWWASIASSHRFRVRRDLKLLPTCRVRLLTECDYESCKAIYHLNEADNFPEGYEGLFTEWLVGKKSLAVAIETDGRLVAFGGINAMQKKWLNLASLTFGMVHPDYQRQGFGTILLLARLALLKKTLWPWQILLSPGLTSGTFYSQFGFRFLSRNRSPLGQDMDTFAAVLRPAERVAFDRVFSAISISPEVRHAVIPPMTGLGSEPKTIEMPGYVSDRQR